jgi:hypothetical protein
MQFGSDAPITDNPCDRLAYNSMPASAQRMRPTLGPYSATSRRNSSSSQPRASAQRRTSSGSAISIVARSVSGALVSCGIRFVNRVVAKLKAPRRQEPRRSKRRGPSPAALIGGERPGRRTNLGRLVLGTRSQGRGSECIARCRQPRSSLEPIRPRIFSARWRDQPKPATLGDLVRLGEDLSTWCPSCGRHGAKLRPEDLIPKLGSGRPLPSMARLLCCTRCGRRGGR